MNDNETMIKEVVTQWEQYGDESACPYCGTPNMTARTGFDEWADEDGRWVALRWQCDKCGGEWWSTYVMSCAGLTPVGETFQTGCQNPAKSARRPEGHGMGLLGSQYDFLIVDELREGK